MRWTAALVLRIAHALLLLAVANAQQQISNAPGDFDFFWFVLQWPGSRSSNRFPCCYPPDGKPMSDFLIHGLWPQKHGQFVEYCSNETFDESQVESIVPELNKVWPSLDCPHTGSVAQNPTFWNHEWERHGTCSAMTQIEYFKAALALWNRLHETDFLTSLHEYAIDPSDTGVTYSRSLISQVLNNALWSKFAQRYENASSIRENALTKNSASTKVHSDDDLAVWTKCGFNAHGEGIFQLAEIWVCLDRQNKHPIICPKPNGLICGEDIPFHTFQECTGLNSKTSQPQYWRTYISHTLLILVGLLGVFAKRTGSYVRTMTLILSLLGVYFIQQTQYYGSVSGWL